MFHLILHAHMFDNIKNHICQQATWLNYSVRLCRKRGLSPKQKGLISFVLDDNADNLADDIIINCILREPATLGVKNKTSMPF